MAIFLRPTMCRLGSNSAQRPHGPMTPSPRCNRFPLTHATKNITISTGRINKISYLLVPSTSCFAKLQICFGLSSQVKATQFITQEPDNVHVNALIRPAFFSTIYVTCYVPACLMHSLYYILYIEAEALHCIDDTRKKAILARCQLWGHALANIPCPLPFVQKTDMSHPCNICWLL